MKLLVFAHKPPPYHGQSYMVQQLLEVLGGDRRRLATGTASDSAANETAAYHVDCRLSDETSDIGRASLRKVFRLLRYCLEATWCRWRFGASNFLYVPAPGMRSAVYRDWILMLLCRPFFRRRVYFWQAAGLGAWMNQMARPWERWLTRTLLGNPDLSIVMSEFCRSDALAFGSRSTEVIPNGVADPCPDFKPQVELRRRQRAARCAGLISTAGSAGVQSSTAGGLEVFRVLFLSLCTREKGLFDCLDAVAMANETLASQGVKLRIQLKVAGKFWPETERGEFEARVATMKWPVSDSDQSGDSGRPVPSVPMVEYCGFASGDLKRQLFLESDCFCFPTYYLAESFGIVIAEAMAYGLPIVTTRWRMMPELLPAGYPGLVDIRSPDQLSRALIDMLGRDLGGMLREHYLANFRREHFASRIRDALSRLEL